MLACMLLLATAPRFCSCTLPLPQGTWKSVFVRLHLMKGQAQGLPPAWRDVLYSWQGGHV